MVELKTFKTTEVVGFHSGADSKTIEVVSFNSELDPINQHLTKMTNLWSQVQDYACFDGTWLSCLVTIVQAAPTRYAMSAVCLHFLIEFCVLGFTSTPTPSLTGSQGAADAPPVFRGRNLET